MRRRRLSAVLALVLALSMSFASFAGETETVVDTVEEAAVEEEENSEESEAAAEEGTVEEETTESAEDETTEAPVSEEAAETETAEELSEGTEDGETDVDDETAAADVTADETAVTEEAGAEEAEAAAEEAAEEAQELSEDAEESEASEEMLESDEEDGEDTGCAAGDCAETTDDGITVSLEWDEGAFTDDPSVVIEDLDAETALAYAEEALGDEGVTITKAYGVDITFYVDGEEVQPASAVRVTLELISETASDADNIYVVHKHDGEDAVLLGSSGNDVDTDDSVGQADVSVEEDSGEIAVEMELTEFSGTVVSEGDVESEEEDEEEEDSTDTDTAETPEATVWERSKSKTATNLDENYTSQVTLSLPAASYSGNLDVALVVDGSTSMEQADLTTAAAQLLDELAGYENLTVNVSLTIFGGSTPILYTTSKLLTISGKEGKENLEKITKELTDASYKSKDGRSGSNLQAGVDDARNMLNADKETEENFKYLIILSDGGARMWYEYNTNGEMEAISAVYYGGSYESASSDPSSFIWGYNDDFGQRYGVGVYSNNIDLRDFDDVWEYGEETVTKYGMTSDEATLLTVEKNSVEGDDYIPDINDVKTDPDYITTPEAASYMAAKSIIAAQKEANVVFVSFEYNTGKYNQYAESFKSWLSNKGYVTKYNYNYSDITATTGTSYSDATKLFSSVKDELVQLLGAGSSVVDEIGCTDDYDFDFVNDIDEINIEVGGVALDKELISTTDTAVTYGFGKQDDGTYQFELIYYPEGTTYKDVTYGECFVWEINVPVTIDNTVQLIYSVVLTNPKTAAGTYGTYDADGSEGYTSLYTNNVATLYPVDSSGNSLDPEDFGLPTVSYSVAESEETTTTTTSTGAIAVVKVDADTGAYLSGASFTVYNESAGQYIGTFTTDENGYFSVGPLTLNYTYVITEVTAPDGYILDSTPIRITLTSEMSSNASYPYTIRVENTAEGIAVVESASIDEAEGEVQEVLGAEREVETIAATGDDSNILFWLILMLAAGAGIGGILLVSGKRSRL